MEKKETKAVAPEVKKEEAKVVAEPAPVKEPAAEAKAPAKAEPKKPGRKPGRKPAAQKAEAKKTETKKAAAPAKEEPKKPGRKPGSKTKKTETELRTIVQFAGMDVDVAAVQEKILNKYVESGHRAGAIKKFEIYLNMEEKKAYYVINGKGGDSAYVDLI